MSRFFIRRPIVAIVIAIVTVLGGLVALRGLPIAQFPQIVPPQIIVTAHYPGADAVTIEQSVATPLEQQMNGVDDMLYMQSTQRQRRHDDADGHLRRRHRSRTSIRSTSRTASPRRSPTCRPRSNQFGLDDAQADRPADADRRRSPRRSHTYDALFLANYANINIIDALYRVPGVGEARIFGAGDYAMRIWVKPDLLARLGLTVPDLSARHSAAEHRQSRPARSARNPAPPGQEMTYTVRVAGPAPDAERSSATSPCARTLTARWSGCATSPASSSARSNYQQIGRVERPARLRDRRLPGARDRTRSPSPRASARRWTRCATRFPRDLEFAYTLDTTRPVSEGIREIVITLAEAMVLVDPRRLPVPPELARDAHPDAWRCRSRSSARSSRLPAARLLGQHAVALRPRARHRPRRRRRHRRRRGGGASHRGRHGAAGCHAPGDGRSVRARSSASR